MGGWGGSACANGDHLEHMGSANAGLQRVGTMGTEIGVNQASTGGHATYSNGIPASLALSYSTGGSSHSGSQSGFGGTHPDG